MSQLIYYHTSFPGLYVSLGPGFKKYMHWNLSKVPRDVAAETDRSRTGTIWGSVTQAERIEQLNWDDLLLPEKTPMTPQYLNMHTDFVIPGGLVRTHQLREALLIEYREYVSQLYFEPSRKYDCFGLNSSDDSDKEKAKSVANDYIYARRLNEETLSIGDMVHVLSVRHRDDGVNELNCDINFTLHLQFTSATEVSFDDDPCLIHELDETMGLKMRLTNFGQYELGHPKELVRVAGPLELEIGRRWRDDVPWCRIWNSEELEHNDGALLGFLLELKARVERAGGRYTGPTEDPEARDPPPATRFR